MKVSIINLMMVKVLHMSQIFDLYDGAIRLFCVDWSKETELKRITKTIFSIKLVIIYF